MKIHHSHCLFYLSLAVILLASCQNRNTPVPISDTPPQPVLDVAETHLHNKDYRQLRRLALERLKDESFEEDYDEALYLLVLVHATPESPYFDLDQAQDYTRRLEKEYPDSSYSFQANLLQDLSHQVQEHEMLVNEVQEMSRQLKGSRTELLLSIRSLNQRIETLKSEKALLESHLGLREQEIQVLSEELAEARERASELAEELELLKEIDLKRNRPR